MNAFGVWYFQCGWFVATIIAFFAGVYSSRKNSPALLAAFCVALLLVGLLAFYGKHYC